MCRSGYGVMLDGEGNSIYAEGCPVTCEETCANCYMEDGETEKTTCSWCLDNEKMEDGVEGYAVADDGVGACEACDDENCMDCMADKAVCKKCPELFALVDAECEECGDNCLECDDKDTCTKCDTGFTDQEDGSCMENMAMADCTMM